MSVLFIIILAVILAFGFVLLYGAPYLPTLKPQIKIALELADAKPGQHMLELGCGDGRVMLAALEQGMYVTGYELNPILAFIAWARTRRYRGKATVIWGNFWAQSLPPADSIFTFLLPKYMSKLDNKITQEYTGKKVKLVSFAFKIEGRPIDKEQDGVLLYCYK